MLNLRIVFLAICLFTYTLPNAFAGEDLPKSNRTKYSFNQDWLLYVGDIENGESPTCKDADWKRITLPRAFNEDEAFKVAIDELSTSIVWYRKHFKLPSSAKGKKVFLEFEGIRQAGDIYLNGQHITLHENGIMAFGLDITNLAHTGNKENVIALRIDNSWNYKERTTNSGFQWNDKNFNANYGGIPKNVYLHITGKVYQTLPLYTNLGTTGTYIYAQDINIAKRTAQITAETEVRNESTKPQNIVLETQLRDMDGQLVAMISSPAETMEAGETRILRNTISASGLKFWSWGYGYLYDVYTSLLIDGKPCDVVKTRTGFRKTRFANGMIYLNDRVIQMKGYAQRTSNEWPAVGMSVPAWLSDYSNRLMTESNANLVRWMHIAPWKQDVESCDRVGLIQAMPAGDAEKDVEDRRWEQRKEVMRDAIIYNRNNPSILFYESGNKGISEHHIEEMIAIRDMYDPHGGRAIGSREMLDSKLSEYGGEMLYINKSARMPMWAMEYSRDEGLRKYWDEYSYPFHKDGEGPLYKGKDASDYNRNQDSHAIENVIRWFDYYQQRPGTGKRVSSGGTNIIFSDTNTHFRGEENYRRSGEVDAMRIPKDGFYAHQVMWDGWVDIENYRTHIIGHWNYAPQTVKEVYVVSSGESVELFLNNRSLGKGERTSNFLFTFTGVAWEEGELKAVSYSKEGAVLSSDTRHTAGAPHAIRMTEQHAPDGFKADGADMALIEFEVVDKEGRRCPTVNQTIHFEVQGEAEWRGGLAQGPNNYILSRSLPVECGVNRALIRSTTQAGKIKITASSEGLLPTEVALQSIPYKTAGGLSTYISGEHQPSNLARGETPATPSFSVSRHPIAIVSARAGSNNHAVSAGYDDNELTAWESKGNLSEAWVSYELERDAAISQVVVKLGNWRNKSYPIRITLDGEEIYKGNTPKSLGYVTLNTKVVGKGRFLRIELTGANKDKDDAFGSIVEITGKKEIDSRPTSKESLSIVEIEVYEE